MQKLAKVQNNVALARLGLQVIKMVKSEEKKRKDTNKKRKKCKNLSKFRNNAALPRLSFQVIKQSYSTQMGNAAISC